MVFLAWAVAAPATPRAGVVRLHDKGAVLRHTTQRIGVTEDHMVGRNHDLDLFQLGIGDLDRLWAHVIKKLGPLFSEPYLGADLEVPPTRRRECR